MAKKLYRCYGCMGEFESDRPACEACGIDPVKDTRDKGVVVPLVTIHFDPPSRREGQGLGCAACDPKLKIGVPRCAFTSEPDAVNCAACKATEVFAAQDGFSYGALAIPLAPPTKGG
jgi:hypothetical protein